MMLLAAASIGMLASCNKDDDGGPSTVFTAEVDGDEFTADDIIGWIDGDDVYVYGEDDDGNIIDFDFTLDDVEGGESYDIEDAEIFAAYYNEDDEEYFYAVTGEVSVTTASESRFDATFEFDGTSFNGADVEVTDGTVKTPLEDF